MTAVGSPARHAAAVSTFLRLVEDQALDAATRLAIDEVGGRSPDDVIRTLLAPVQAKVGGRWHRATC